MMPRRISIGIKLALLISVIMIVAAFTVSLLIRFSVDNAIDKIIKNEFEQSLAMAENYFDVLSHIANLTAIHIAEDHTLREYFFSGNFSDYVHYLEHTHADLKVDQIMVLDDKGVLLAQAGSLPFEGENLSHFDFVAETYRTKSFHSTIIRQGDVFVFYSTEPILAGDNVVGMVLVGLTLNNQLMIHMKKSTKMEFSIVGDRAMAATSFTKDGKPLGTLPLPYTEYLWILKNQQIIEASIDNQTYYIAAKPLKLIDPSTNASIMLAYRSDDIAQSRQAVSQNIIIFMSLALFFAIALAFFLSKRVKDTIQQMIDMTIAIKRGRFDVELAVKSNDEFGELAGNLNDMGQALYEKEQRLKAYTDSLETTIAERTRKINLQKNYLNTILDMQPGMILLVVDEKIVFANHAFLDFFGISGHITTDEPRNLSSLFGYDSHAPENVHQLERCIRSIVEEVALDNEIPFFNIDRDKHIFHFSHTVIEQEEGTHLLVFNDISTYKEEQGKLYTLATTDPLTGLANRLRFNEEILQAIRHYQRYEDDTYLIILDIDNFKKINDTYGHDVGDVAIKSIAQMLNSYTRSSDVCARWGGEEFAIILYNTTEEQAQIVADLLRSRIAEEKHEKIGHLTCSFGMTKIGKGDRVDSLFKRADTALYMAKKEGKNRVISIWSDEDMKG